MCKRRMVIYVLISDYFPKRPDPAKKIKYSRNEKFFDRSLI